MFKRLAHVCLHVRDLQRSLAFYRKLGFENRFDFTRKGEHFGAYLEIAEGNYLEIFEDKSLTQVVNTGLVHFCIETEDMDALTRTLTERGVDFSEKKFGADNTWQIWLTDPDGNRFEVHEYTAASTQLTGGVVEADW